MEYLIITLVLWCSAILKVAIQFNKKGHSIYWYLQPFVFPVLMTIGDILFVCKVVDLVPYIAAVGLLFELLNCILYRIKQKGNSNHRQQDQFIIN